MSPAAECYRNAIYIEAPKGANEYSFELIGSERLCWRNTVGCFKYGRLDTQVGGCPRPFCYKLRGLSGKLQDYGPAVRNSPPEGGGLSPPWATRLGVSDRTPWHRSETRYDLDFTTTPVLLRTLPFPPAA